MKLVCTKDEYNDLIDFLVSSSRCFLNNEDECEYDDCGECLEEYFEWEDSSNL